MNLSEKSVLPGWIPFVLNLDSLYKRKQHSKKLYRMGSGLDFQHYIGDRISGVRSPDS
jgi:hypothetical protein